MAVSSVTHNKPILPRTTDTSDLGSNRASVYSGKGLSFDGVNDTVAVEDKSIFYSYGGEITISVWAKWTYSNDNEELFRVENGSNRILFSFQIGNILSFGTKDNNGSYVELDVSITNYLPAIAGRWALYTATHDTDGNRKVYINGYLIGSDLRGEGVYATGNATPYIGSSSGTQEFFTGQMSDFKFFNVALTQTQIQELYNNPEQVLPTGVSQTSLSVHLPMTEGAGSYLYNANANAIGTELISNAGFDETCQKWGTTDSSTVEISGGKAIWTNAPLAGSFVEQPLDLEVGKFYRVSFDYTSTAFNIFVNLGNTQQAVPLGNGRASFDLYYGGGNSSLSFQHGWTTNSSATVDNVSVKEVVPNYYNGSIVGATWVSGLPEPLPQTALMDWNRYERQATEDNLDYYQGTLTIPTNNGTIVFKHVTDPLLSDNKYIFGLGTSTLGLSRAIRLRSTGKYGFVSYGSSNEDFDTSVSYTPGKPTTFALSWDETKYVNIYSDGLFAQSVYKSGLNNLSGSRTLRLYGSNFNANSNRGTIIYWAYYNRVLTATEINDINTGKVEPTDVDDLEYYFTHQNGYSYNGVTLTKTGGDFDRLLIPSGSTSGKDVFGNTISNPRASGAYNFDGASYVQGLNKGYLPTGDEARSLELWVYHRPVAGATASQSLMEIGSGAGANNRFGIMVTSPADTLYMVGQANDNAFGSFSIPENEWTHIVATHDGTTLKVYRNGSLAGSVPETYATIDVGYRIGLENRTTSETSISGSYEWTRSQIANPRIYNYALTAEQVADNFNEKASTFGGTKVASELDAYIERTASDGATVEAHSCLINYLTELDKK